MIVEERFVLVQRKAHPFGIKPGIVERIHHHDRERDIKKGINQCGSRPQPDVGSSHVLLAMSRGGAGEPCGQSCHGQHREREHDRQCRTKRPVPGTEELVFDQVADENVPRAAQDVGYSEHAQHGDEYQG